MSLRRHRISWAERGERERIGKAFEAVAIFLERGDLDPGRPERDEMIDKLLLWGRALQDGHHLTMTFSAPERAEAEAKGRVRLDARR
jgi:hypothetical protein